MALELSLAGIYAEIQNKVSNNLIRNPFFVADPLTPANASAWTIMTGSPSLVASAGSSNQLTLPPSAVVQSTYFFPINSGQDTLTLPDFGICAFLNAATVSSTDNLKIDILNQIGTVVATQYLGLSIPSLSLQYATINLPVGTTYIKIRLTAPATNTVNIRFVSLTPGDTIPGYFSTHALSEDDITGIITALTTTISNDMVTLSNSLNDQLDSLNNAIPILVTKAIQIDAALVSTGVDPSVGSRYGVLPTTATITGTSSNLGLTSNTGLSVTFTAANDCAILIGGCSAAQGGDDNGTGGGHCGYVLQIIHNSTLVNQSTIWLANDGAYATAGLNLVQNVSNTSGNNPAANVAFPCTAVQMVASDTLTITFNDRSNLTAWINNAWEYRLHLVVS